MTYTIYLITNKINNKKYVGQTAVSLEKRWSRHRWRCTLKAQRQPITEAMLKYGVENFNIFPIDFADSLEDSNRKEVFWGMFYNCLSPNGYNLKLGGRKYSELSQEIKDKISAGNRGKKASPETIKRLSESHKGFKITDETKKKLSILNKGKKPHPNANKAASLKTAKKYILITPDNIEIEVINMRRFCIDNNLCQVSMSAVANKRKPFYKGWRCKEIVGRMNAELGSRRKPLLQDSSIKESLFEDLALGAPIK